MVRVECKDEYEVMGESSWVFGKIKLGVRREKGKGEKGKLSSMDGRDNLFKCASIILVPPLRMGTIV
jgi:hypothetical protein